MAASMITIAMSLEKLRNDNYENWSVCVRNYLIANDLWDIIESETDDPPPEIEHEVEFKAWRKKNAAASLAIQVFSSENVLTKIRKIESAKIAWDELAKMYQPQSLLLFDSVNPAQLDRTSSGVNIEGSTDVSHCEEVDNPVDLSQPQEANPEIDELHLSLPQGPKSRFDKQPFLIDEDKKVEETKEGNERSYAGEGNSKTEVIIRVSNKVDKSTLPPQPPAIELTRRQTFTRSKFSKPKSRFQEQLFLIDEAEQVEESQKINTGVSEGHSSPGKKNESDSRMMRKSSELKRRLSFTRSNFSKPNSCFAEPDGYPQFQLLIHAINKGDLKGVKAFIEHYPEAKTAKIIPDGSTALHVACNAGQLKIAKELVGRLSEKDLKIKDMNGNTALAVVARNAVLISIAECLIRKNKELIEIRTNQGFLPVVSAALRYHKDMTRYLYRTFQDEEGYLDGKNGSTLLIANVAMDVIKIYPKFTTTKSVTGVSSPLRALSRAASIFPSSSKLSFWKRPIYSCIPVSLPSYQDDLRVNIPHNEESDKRKIIRRVLDYFRRLGSTIPGISGIKKLYEMKLMHRQALVILRCMSEKISTLQLMDPNYIEVRESMFKAVQYGTVEFVVEMVKYNPHLLYIRDENYNGIFQYAVQYRQEKIFSLLYGLDARKYSLITSVDLHNCTITHLAGLLAPSSRLTRIWGAPLQMQRELQWYKEVKSVVGSMYDLYFNKERETPDEVFTKNHKQLVKDGEEWMKQAASSCTVVGALIITVMFTAAFTIPGGNDQSTGYPMFLHKKLFTIFIISDAVSLFFSTTSVLMFLAILTSRYAEEDFLKSLPTKLIIGLSTLFMSIASMMIAFCAAVILMLKGELHIVVPLASLACIPIGLFGHLQFPLLREIFMSTYGPSIFDRNMKPWL
ncbi:hypothetical protein ACFE04_000555 [Oxalis oulophora]